MMLTWFLLNFALETRTHAATENGFCVTSTLVMNERNAILFDAQILNSEADRVVSLVKESGRTLDAVYITHGHPDHYFGLGVIHAAFPKAKLLAHPEVLAEIRATWKAKHTQWKPLLGSELADVIPDISPHSGSTLSLGKDSIRLLPPLQGDTHVSIAALAGETLIAGDLSFAGVHPWLADTRAPQWRAWIAALESLEAQKPLAVISGHRAAGRRDDPGDLRATREYIRAFAASAAAAKSAKELIDAMAAAYPSLVLPIILKISAEAASR